jgi:hypothetical protein
MYGHVFGRVDSNADLIALYAQYGHRDFVADHHGLANTPGQYQHNRAPSFVGVAAAAFIADHATPSSVVRGSSGDSHAPPGNYSDLSSKNKDYCSIWLSE